MSQTIPTTQSLHLSADNALQCLQDLEDCVYAGTQPQLFVDDVTGLSREFILQLVQRFPETYFAGNDYARSLSQPGVRRLGRRTIHKFVLASSLLFASGAMFGTLFG